ncbi:MAG: hypothetical protein JWR74_2852 [Polaromonas sp.]|nr:hypothetical protein [Polaromonas sp.]
MSTTAAFKGLNNVSDKLRLGLAWLTQADNIDISDTGAIKKRAGYTLAFAGATTAAYATLDEQRCFVVDGGQLKALTGPDAAVLLLSGLASAPMHWTEVNGQVFFSNGVDSGIIQPDNEVLPWRESALRDIEFLNAAGEAVGALLDPLPLGVGVIQHWKGRIYCAQYFPEADQSAVWFSQPLGFHLFALDTDFILLPGRVTMLAPHDSALLIGTDRAIHAYTAEGLVQLAPYGVVPGQHWADDDKKRTLFWSQRGLCAGLPFANLTERQVSVAPGLAAAGALVLSKGQKRYLVALQQGGTPFNSLN